MVKQNILVYNVMLTYCMDGNLWARVLLFLTHGVEVLL